MVPNGVGGGWGVTRPNEPRLTATIYSAAGWGECSMAKVKASGSPDMSLLGFTILVRFPGFPLLRRLALPALSPPWIL